MCRDWKEFALETINVVGTVSVKFKLVIDMGSFSFIIS